MKVKNTKYQSFLEGLTAILVLSTWIFLMLNWSSIPNTVPGHYNAAGIVDRWGNKNEILIIPIASIVLYLLVTIASFFPGLWNVPVKITEGSRKFVYENLKTLLLAMKMEISAIFLYILYCDIKTQAVGMWFLPIILIMIFGTIIYYIIVIRKRSK